MRLDVLFASDGVDSPDSCALVVHLSTNATPSHHLRRSATPDQTSVAAPARHPDHARGVTRRAGSIVIVDDADGRTTYYFVNIHRLLSCARSIVTDDSHDANTDDLDDGNISSQHCDIFNF